ncbi:hypothetical protein FA95DRAFT_1600839 [Auriscalpium vulgare]|uniref:Uncharacterized protein n=1 Tax=Auriscalpium vulgare TaxID=40419 RepID=A0ACB8SB58_9AGAM|nr:hypothetical protein FA95DRAFT_1600839 [Auriscalpium vulgare]
MPPQTRSSAPSTPVSKRVSSDSIPKSARKSPHCRTCHRPRAGHPRDSCPQASPTQSPTSPTQSPTSDGSDIATALDSMQIHPPKGERVRGRRALPLPDPSLASLSTESSAILNGLLKPGIMGDDPMDEDEDNTFLPSKVQDTPQTPPKSHRNLRGRIMPGTLDTPNSTILDVENWSSQRTKASPSPSLRIDSDSALKPDAGRQSLARSMSIQERQAFLDGLAQISNARRATVYTVPIGDLPTLQESASRLGFKTRVLTSKKGSKETDCLLVIGTDGQAVDTLHDSLAHEEPGASNLRTVAKGALVGAVATFTGLAFT